MLARLPCQCGRAQLGFFKVANNGEGDSRGRYQDAYSRWAAHDLRGDELHRGDDLLLRSGGRNGQHTENLHPVVQRGEQHRKRADDVLQGNAGEWMLRMRQEVIPFPGEKKGNGRVNCVASLWCEERHGRRRD